MPQVAPKQEDFQAPEALLQSASPKDIGAPGLRSRATAARRRDDEPCDLVVPQKALRRWLEDDAEAALLCVDGPSNPCHVEPLLAVESKAESQAPSQVSYHRLLRRRRRRASCSDARRRANAGRGGARRGAFRERSVHREDVPGEAKRMTPEACRHARDTPPDVAEAYGFESYQSGWDWPLSRLEKKMRLLELDRELMKAERDELAEELHEVRRLSGCSLMPHR